MERVYDIPGETMISIEQRKGFPHIPLRILTGARERVEKGWCQGISIADRKGKEWDGQAGCGPKQHDLWGALVMATGTALSHRLKTPIFETWLDYVADLLGDLIGGEYLVLWNDHAERTQSEVLSLIDMGIEQLSESNPRLEGGDGRT